MRLFNFLFEKKPFSFWKKKSSSVKNASMDEHLHDALQGAIDYYNEVVKKAPIDQSFHKQGVSLASFDYEMLSINSIDFFGSYNKSESKKWIIGWSDSDRSEGFGGHRESGHGHYVLYDSEKDEVILQGNKLERPNGGSVSNEGIFSLEDCHFGSDLLGTFYVFSSSGNILFKKKLEANIYNSGISKSGSYAACQTANSDSDDGNKLCFFDILNKKELFSIEPPTGWADNYEFDEEKSLLIVCFNGIGKFRYASDGNFLDENKFQDCSLNSTEYVRVILTAEEILSESNLTSDRARLALEAVIRARTSLGADKNEAWKPQALKVQGLAHEVVGEYKEAMFALENALKINPKIGVKRKIASLKKKLNLSSMNS